MKSPTKEGISEYIEKRSRFIGQCRYVSSESEAREFISSVKKEYHDARHNCWCYITSGAERYSDDGEPQGTAGIPMLEIMKKENVTDAVCVVTRYFGGILLGTGGLLRAYSKACKDALADSSPEEIIEMKALEFDVSYSDLETIKNAVTSYNGRITDITYSESVHISAEMPETEEFEKNFLWKK